MQFRYQDDPNDPLFGDVVIEVHEHVVRFWREIPETLDGPPYFCLNLMNSEGEKRPGEKDYYTTSMKHDYSETWEDCCSYVRKDKLIEALEEYEREKNNETDED